MIEIGKKYRLKKIKDHLEKDSEEFTVIGFYNNNIAMCLSHKGEKYLFLKDFLIDPDYPNEIYTKIEIRKD